MTATTLIANRSVELVVVSAKDASHAALAQQRLDAVSSGAGNRPHRGIYGVQPRGGRRGVAGADLGATGMASVSGSRPPSASSSSLASWFMPQLCTNLTAALGALPDDI